MHCFNHPDIPAIGICSACSKGICPECVTDLDHGLACKDKHEARVESTSGLISRNVKAASATTGYAKWIAPAFYLFMGLSFAGTGLFARDTISWFAVIMGCGFIIFSFATLFYALQIWGKKK